MKLFKGVRDNGKDHDNKMINRREALTKASCMALSVATMMVLMKSQSAMAASAAQVDLASAKRAAN